MKFRKRFMSVVRTLLFVISTALVLISCGGGGGSSPSPTPAPSPAPDTTPVMPVLSMVDVDLNIPVDQSFTVAGINQEVEISISSGMYSINGGDFSSGASRVVNGDEVTVRVQSSESFSTTTEVTVELGTISFNVSVVTLAEDLLPDDFAFDALTGQEPGAVVMSTMATVTGINSIATASVTGGAELSVNGGEFTSGPSPIENGQTIQIRALASEVLEETLSYELSVSEFSALFNVTTRHENNLPTAELIFPLRDAYFDIDVPSLIVTGKADDDSGVASVTVNGQRAEITSEVNGAVYWQSTVFINNPELNIVVGVEDIKGNVDSLAAEVTVTEAKPVFYDTVVDFENELVLGKYVDKLYALSLEDKDLVDTYHVGFIDGDYCYRPIEGEVVYPVLSDQQVSVRGVNLETSEINVYATFSFAPEDYGHGEDVYSSFSGLVCDDIDRNNAYYLTHFRNRDTTNTIQSILGKINLTSLSPYEVIQQTGLDDSEWMANNFVIDEGEILTALDTPRIMDKIEPVSKTVENLHNGAWPGTLVNLDAMAWAKDDEILFFGDLDSQIRSFDFSSDTIVDVSVAEKGAPLEFTQIEKIFHDDEEGDLVVNDWVKGELIQVDLATGERELLYTSSMYSGPKLIWARDIVISNDLGSVYLIDDGSNAGERVVKVDVETGHRVQIGDITQEFNTTATGIELDLGETFLFVSFTDKIIKIDLETEVAEIIASDFVGTGPAFEGASDIYFNSYNELLYYSDAVSEAIYSVDPDTGIRVRVSELGLKGDGPGFIDLVSIALGESESIMYAANQGDNSIYAVDLETGDRQLLLNTCVDANAQNVFEYISFVEISFDSYKNELIISGDQISAAVDLETLQCRRIRGGEGLVNRFSDGSYLRLERDALYLINDMSYSGVILSR
jgi:sugar lactone lactonase YvrE